MSLVRLALAAALLLVACTTEHEIGSTCPEGICEPAQLSSGVPCLIETSQARVEPPGFGSDAQCVIDPVPLVDGIAACRLFLRFVEGAGGCEAFGLQPVEVDGITGPVCELPQLPPGDREAGSDKASGWFIDGPLSTDDECWEQGDQRVRFNGMLEPSTSVTLSCASAVAHYSDVEEELQNGQEPVHIPPARCASLPPLPDRTPSSLDLASACAPRVAPRVQPANEYQLVAGRYYIDVRSQQCSTGVCLVDAVNAPIVTPCTPPEVCESELVLDDFMYCSCRCNAKGDNTRVECICPTGFTCVDVLTADVPEPLSGGYCVQN